MDRISHLSHKPMSSFFQYQNPSASHTIRQVTAPTQYNMSSSFVPNGQSTLSPQQTNAIGTDMRHFQSHVSTTPCLSYDTSPDSIFSAPYQPAIAGNESRELGSPASTVSAGNRAPLQRSTMPLLQTLPGHERDSDSQEGKPYDDWVSAHDGDSSDWLNNYEHQGTLDQTHDQQTVHPDILADDILQPPHKSSTMLPDQALPNSGTETTNDWEPILGLRDFSVPPSFDDLAGEVDHSSFPLYQQSAYAQQQHDIDGYQQELNFNVGPYGNNVYSNMYVPAGSTVPSLGSGPTLGGTHGAGGRGRQGNQDAQKDELLVRLRQEGKSYKDIMKMNIFNLEESTLRGRYRTLTKSKEQRLRKPAWDSQAVSLSSPSTVRRTLTSC